MTPVADPFVKSYPCHVISKSQVQPFLHSTLDNPRYSPESVVHDPGRVISSPHGVGNHFDAFVSILWGNAQLPKDRKARKHT